MQIKPRTVNGARYKVAFFLDSPPTSSDVEVMLAEQVSGVSLIGDGVGGRGTDLQWLARIENLRYLDVSRSGGVPPIPGGVFERLEVFEWIGSTSQVLSTADLPEVRSLAV